MPVKTNFITSAYVHLLCLSACTLADAIFKLFMFVLLLLLLLLLLLFTGVNTVITHT